MAGTNKGISSDLITLRVESPSCPDVTLIDLPGITRCAVGDQPADICAEIKNLLTDYIEKPNTIIMCVIPCTVDIATNEALTMAKEVDPQGIRTLGKRYLIMRQLFLLQIQFWKDLLIIVRLQSNGIRPRGKL